MSIRMIFSDVDGTIWPIGGRISDRTRGAVHAAQAAGIPFVIASGRWYVTAKQVADELGLTEGYMIVANGGAVVKMDGTLLRDWIMDPADAKRIYDVFSKYPVLRTSTVRDGFYALNVEGDGRWAHDPGAYLFGNRRAVYGDQAEFERCGFINSYRLTCAGAIEDLNAIREELAPFGYSLSSAYPDNLEVMGPGCGKGTALKWLAEYLGVDPADCMAFGDNTNDLEMLQAAGWPVAMDNAVDELKAAARIIAPDSADDGVAQVIDRVLRGEIQ